MADSVKFVVNYYSQRWVQAHPDRGGLPYEKVKDGVRELSHQYTESWVKTRYYCPGCGVQAVWMNDDSGGDYYVGERHLCVACARYFYLPHGVVAVVGDEQDEQRLAHIRAGASTETEA